MVTIFGNSIVNASTCGQQVDAIYAYGEQVWPEYSFYYIRWRPFDISGSFKMNSSTYSFEDYNGFFSGFNGSIDNAAFKNNGDIIWVKTNALSLGAHCFESNYYLETISLPKCQFISGWAFEECQRLGSVYLPACTLIGYYAFEKCWRLSEVNAPNCTYVSQGAFERCTSLQTVNIPKCSYIAEYAFNMCGNIKNFNAESCEYVGEQAFGNNDISYLNLPVCSYIGEGAFGACTRLNSVNLPSCEIISNGAFNNCKSLLSVSLSGCKELGYYVFISCYSLSTAYLGSYCSVIGNYAFEECSSLTELTIEYSSVCTLGSSSVFWKTPFASGSGSIYVPSSLVSAYKSASYWSSLSSIIYPISN